MVEAADWDLAEGVGFRALDSAMRWVCNRMCHLLCTQACTVHCASAGTWGDENWRACRGFACRRDTVQATTDTLFSSTPTFRVWQSAEFGDSGMGSLITGKARTRVNRSRAGFSCRLVCSAMQVRVLMLATSRRRLDWGFQEYQPYKAKRESGKKASPLPGGTRERVCHVARGV